MLNSNLTPEQRKGLSQILPEDRIKDRLIDRYAYASDASHYYLVPLVIVQPVNEAEVKELLRWARGHRLPVTFRSGGTSLSGQGVTDGVLADLSNHWRKVVPLDDGRQVSVEPGVVGANVNVALRRFGRKMGPDPASIGAAMMGGILSNNSSGMCCGVLNNAYHTMQSIRFILPDGRSFDTASPGEQERFLEECPEIASGLSALRTEVMENEELVTRIRKKYRQKNTVGYSLNAFVDHTHPLDILAHLLIGGEGTLAFISRAVLRTVPDHPCKVTGMLYFSDPRSACDAIPALRDTGAAALEFMDRASLRSVEHIPGVPAFFREMTERECAILCEYQDETDAKVKARQRSAEDLIGQLPLTRPPEFTSDTGAQALLWKIRKGMYPSVAGMRATGTSALMEDCTFPVERLGEAIEDVQDLFLRHGYDNGIIFGHAKDGNLHFVVSQSFAGTAEVAHYKQFNDDLFSLVLDKYQGSLKGEHSTGRAVTPFVETEWGTAAYDVMKKLKRLIDPDVLLNPGIIVGTDPDAYVRHLKVIPAVDASVDKCIECGFCEKKCPSRDVTLTPRRRIGILRAAERLRQEGEVGQVQELEQAFRYDGLHTCATDGLCALECPVEINTGEVVKELRLASVSGPARRISLMIAEHFSLATRIVRVGVRVGLLVNRVFGQRSMSRVTGFIRRFASTLPLWDDAIQPPARIPSSTAGSAHREKVVYLPSCVTRMMGGQEGASFFSVCSRAGIGITIPDAVGDQCCGQSFSSKGYKDAAGLVAARLVEQLWEATEGGIHPVVLDVTSCTQTVLSCGPSLPESTRIKHGKLRFMDSISFAADHLLPALSINKVPGTIAVHPVCSAQKLGLSDKFISVVRACSASVVVPQAAGCCGMAGDRGFLFPELTRAATLGESSEVNGSGAGTGCTTARTCAMALTSATGIPYRSLISLVDEASQPLA